MLYPIRYSLFPLLLLFEKALHFDRLSVRLKNARDKTSDFVDISIYNRNPITFLET